MPKTLTAYHVFEGRPTIEVIWAEEGRHVVEHPTVAALLNHARNAGRDEWTASDLCAVLGLEQPS